MMDLVVFIFHYATKSYIFERGTSRTKYSSVIFAAFIQKDKQSPRICMSLKMCPINTVIHSYVKHVNKYNLLKNIWHHKLRF